jgi:hypothetical protein
VGTEEGRNKRFHRGERRKRGPGLLAGLLEWGRGLLIDDFARYVHDFSWHFRCSPAYLYICQPQQKLARGGLLKSLPSSRRPLAPVAVSARTRLCPFRPSCCC